MGTHGDCPQCEQRSGLQWGLSPACRLARQSETFNLIKNPRWKRYPPGALSVAGEGAEVPDPFAPRLKTAGVIYRQSGQWLLKDPYCRWELHKTRTANYTRSDGQPASNLYTVWTERGRRFITALHDADYDPHQAPRLLRDLLSPPADAEPAPEPQAEPPTADAQ